MILKLRPTMLGASALLTLGLTACGGGDSDADNTTATVARGGSAPTAAAGGDAPAVPVTTLAQGGIDACFNSIRKLLGPDTKVYSISSRFSPGKLDKMGLARKPEGEMTNCSVQYQNPQDPRKLVQNSIDYRTGTFGEPKPVELNVMGGNTSAFKLDDYLIPLSQVNTSGVKAIMDAHKAELDKGYSRYTWTDLNLEEPGMGRRAHELRLAVAGRLASNDLLDTGYMELSPDGKVLTKRLVD